MTKTERGARGVWLVAAVVAGLALVQTANGDSLLDAGRALAYGLVLLLSLIMVHDASRRH